VRLLLKFLPVGDAGEGDFGAGEGFDFSGDEAEGDAIAALFLIEVVHDLGEAFAALDVGLDGARGGAGVSGQWGLLASRWDAAW